MKAQRYLKLVLILVGFCYYGHCQVYTTSNLADIDDFINTLMTCTDEVGLSVAVVNGDDTWTKSYGLANVESNEDATDDTLFCIGSITKAFTATLLAKIIDEKNSTSVSWDSRVHDLLGAMYVFIDDARTKDARLSDLLAHRMGLSADMISGFSGSLLNISREEASKRIRFLTEQFPLRYQFYYSNYMYLLAGHVAEALSGGESWESLIKKKIFDPIGMTSSDIINPDTLEDGRFALPYGMKNNSIFRHNKILYDIHPNQPAGAICSTNGDMAKWMRFHLSGGKVEDGSQLIDPEILKATYRARTSIYGLLRSTFKPEFPVEIVDSSYGLGWVMGSYNGYRTLVHGGRVNSYQSFIQLYPDMKHGVYVASNGIGSGAIDQGLQLITYYLSDILSGNEPWLNTSTACTYPRPWQTTRPPPPSAPANNWPRAEVKRPLSDYTGKFGHGFMGDVEVIDKGISDTLFLKYTLLEGTMTRDQDYTDLFHMEITGLVSFLSDVGGTVITYPVLFREDDKGHISELVATLAEQTVFRRNVSFDDALTKALIDELMPSSAASTIPLPFLVLIFLFGTM